jgi:hypothetical protein
MEHRRGSANVISCGADSMPGRRIIADSRTEQCGHKISRFLGSGRMTAYSDRLLGNRSEYTQLF